MNPRPLPESAKNSAETSFDPVRIVPYDAQLSSPLVSFKLIVLMLLHVDLAISLGLMVIVGLIVQRIWNVLVSKLDHWRLGSPIRIRGIYEMALCS